MTEEHDVAQASTKWQLSEVPTDRFVQRWHRVWNCPITVKRMTDEERQSLGASSEDEWWIEATRSTTWPETSFTKHWAEAERPPAGVDLEHGDSRILNARLSTRHPDYAEYLYSRLEEVR